jgi:hypothetical protein
MNKKKVIVVRSTILQRFRNNLRRILILESSKRRGEVLDEYLFIEHSNGALQSLSPEEERKVIKLSSLSNHISQVLRASICVCSKCQSTDRSMAYNPTFKKWYCLQCFKDLREIYFNEKPLMIQEGTWNDGMEIFHRSFL